MSAQHTVSIVFLCIAVGGLALQYWGLRSILMHRRPMPSPRRTGLTRTVACRVFASCVYVLVGINAATFQRDVATISLTAFGVTQLLWSLNTVMDKRIVTAQHPGPRRIQVTITRVKSSQGGS